MDIKKHAFARVLIVIGLLGALVGFPQAAHAADNGRWSAFPATAKGNNVTPRQYFIVDTTPGSVVKDAAVLKNNTNAPLRLNLYPADAFNTALGGGFALKKQDDQQTDVGTWLKLSKSQVLIPAAKKVKDSNGKSVVKPGSVTVPFTMTVPAGATPGDHAGGFVTIDANTIPAPNQTGLTIRQANAIRIYARVAGPITPQLLVSNVKFLSKTPRKLPFVGKPGKAVVGYTVVNSGNVRITPTATITLTGLFGQTIATVPASVPEILPGQSVTLQEPVDKLPALDRVDVKVALTTSDYPEVKPVGTTSAWSISWLFVAIIVIVIAVIVGFFVDRRRRRRRGEVASGEGGSRRAGATAGSTPAP